MKIQINAQNIEHNGCEYTRIQWSDKSFMWFNGFDNTNKSLLDEVDFGDKKTINKLESLYQKIKQ